MKNNEISSSSLFLGLVAGLFFLVVVIFFVSIKLIILAVVLILVLLVLLFFRDFIAIHIFLINDFQTFDAELMGKYVSKSVER